MARTGPVSHRLILFQALGKCRQGLCGRELRPIIGLDEISGHLAILIRGEVRLGRVTIDELEVGNDTVPYYFLTPSGRKALKNGTVDSGALATPDHDSAWSLGRMSEQTYQAYLRKKKRQEEES